MLTIIKLIKLLFPLLKEYLFSDTVPRVKILTIALFTIQIITLVVMTIYVSYGLEQANNNMEIHTEIIDQYHQLEKNNQLLVNNNRKLEENIKFYETRLLECHTENINMHSKESVYDPKTGRMVTK